MKDYDYARIELPGGGVSYVFSNPDAQRAHDLLVREEPSVAPINLYESAIKALSKKLNDRIDDFMKVGLATYFQVNIHDSTMIIIDDVLTEKPTATAITTFVLRGQSLARARRFGLVRR